MEARIHPAIAFLLLFVFASFHAISAQPLPAPAQAPQPQLSDADIDTLLEDLRVRGFFTGATILSYVAKSNVAPSSTILIPTDISLAQAVSIEPRDYAALIKFHILETDFNINQLRVLPVGTWIPTALQGYGVEVTNNSQSDFSLNNARIIDPDICPRVAQIGLSCQGVSAILDPKSQSSERPNNPPLFVSPPAPLQTSSPSPSPLASEPVAPVSSLQFLSPSSSPLPSPSFSPSSSPSSPAPSPALMEPVIPEESPVGAISPVPSAPVFQAPIPLTIPPASSPIAFPPFFADEPAPGPSATSGALSVVSQTNTLAFAMLGGIILAMI